MWTFVTKPVMVNGLLERDVAAADDRDVLIAEEDPSRRAGGHTAPRRRVSPSTPAISPTAVDDTRLA